MNEADFTAYREKLGGDHIDDVQAALARHAYPLFRGRFSADDGEVTPTMKVRRKQITDHYIDRIEAYRTGLRRLD